MGFFMGEKSENNKGELPPRIKAAFDYLEHARDVTTQWHAAIPARDLSKLEKSVETAALRALQQYLLGEMDYVEPPSSSRPEGGEGTSSAPTSSPK
jgi:hypothetical protein